MRQYQSKFWHDLWSEMCLWILMFNINASNIISEDCTQHHQQHCNFLIIDTSQIFYHHKDWAWQAWMMNSWEFHDGHLTVHCARRMISLEIWQASAFSYESAATFPNRAPKPQLCMSSEETKTKWSKIFQLDCEDQWINDFPLPLRLKRTDVRV